MHKETKNNLINQYPHKFITAQTTNLIRQLNRALNENKKIYTEIVHLDQHFTFKLYQPIKHQGIDQMFLKPLVLRQIDQLLEEKQMLITKKQMLNFRIMEQKNKKQNEVNNSASHYSFLRNTWTRLQLKAANSGQRFDNLNKIVGIIKNNIKQITQNQQKIINEQIQNQNIKTCYIQRSAFEKNRQDLERTKMRNQQLETKFFQLEQIIEQKNKKIQMLQFQLYKAGNRIKQSIQTFNLTGEKMQNQKKNKHSLECQIKKLQNSAQETNYMLFNSANDDFKIKIQTNAVGQIKFQQTNKNLVQIMEFLRQKYGAPTLVSTHNLDTQQTSSELQVPCLNLNYTQCTNETAWSSRQFAKNFKFIPMRTQRSCLLRNQFKYINNSESAEQDSQEHDNNRHDTSFKRFSRKNQFPLTSDRFRKSKLVEEDKKSLIRIQQ